jgi:hypothetical protein
MLVGVMPVGVLVPGVLVPGVLLPVGGEVFTPPTLGLPSVEGDVCPLPGTTGVVPFGLVGEPVPEPAPPRPISDPW